MIRDDFEPKPARTRALAHPAALALVQRAALAMTLGWVAAACAQPAAPRLPPTAAGAKSAATRPRRFASPYTYEWFVRAELLRGRGQLVAACEAYRAALAGADEDAYVQARLATALDERGDHAAAREALRAAQRLEPDSEAIWLAEAELAQRAGAFESALAALEHAEQAQPLSARAPLQLAALLRARGFPERADAVLLRFEARSLPGTAGALAARVSRAISGGDAQSVWQASLPYRLGAPPQPELLRQAARRLFERARPAQALRLLELVPELPGEDNLRLAVLAACGRFAEAELWLGSHPPQVADDWLAAAQVYLALGRFEAAADSVEAAALAPRDSVADSFGAGAGSPRLQLLAAEIALARGAYARAAGLFAELPSGSAHFSAARAGLRRALSAQGLSELAAELPAQ